MSWDIVIFSSKQKISSLDDIDEEQLLPTDFNATLERHFDNIILNDDHRKIIGDNFSIEYFVHNELVSNALFNLYGEAALFELIRLAKTYSWQIFDTGIGEMLDLDNPKKNGYENFQSYLQHVLAKPDNDATN